MPRFYFHIRDNGVLYEDPEGLVCTDVAEASAGAHQAMQDFLRDTRHVVGAWAVAIEIVDEQGNLLAAHSSREVSKPAACEAAFVCQ
ncbi:DUF6894 family protein [Rhizobium sp. YIM 134829]|uniref:DUF6894 family protein n=1 Tax=Rhizobium sp. YIM 134829 TaxID=3390453 RepID=UPI00397D2E2D